MVAVTYDVARVPASQADINTAPKAAPRKSWFGHFIDVLIEARKLQAQQEIRMHTQLLPYTLDGRGSRVIKTETGDMPLSGW
jgi:hypothetical protein